MAAELNEADLRPPSLIDALIPVGSLVALIGLTIYLFGTDATNGPLQVALLLSASIAALVAHKNRHDYFAISEAIVGGISTAMGAIFILLAVGALIGAYQEDDSVGLRALLPLAGRTLVEYQVRCAAAAGATPIVVLVERIPPALH